MSRGTMLILLGFLTALAPFSGLPSTWIEFILPVLGLTIALIGSAVRPRKAEVVQIAEANIATVS